MNFEFPSFEIMCYDAKQLLEKALRKAEHDGAHDAANRIRDEIRRKYGGSLLDHHHTSGFSHPKLIIYTSLKPSRPILSTWGLIPSWAKEKNQIWDKTLNAKSETIFEKPSFKNSAISRRCIIPLDGFYEHHHKNGKTFPYFIKRKGDESMNLGGLWNEWTDNVTGDKINTFSIITTKGNDMMSHIHNNPKLVEPRMPFIVPDELQSDWLKPIEDELDQKMIQDLIQPYPDEELISYTVRRLKGKKAVGNVPEASNPFEYEELAPTLFD